MALTVSSRPSIANSGLPIDLTPLLPCALSQRTVLDIQQLVVRRGNRSLPLGELFDVDGDPTDESLKLCGDLRAVNRLGTRMTRGRITITGDIGRHLGSQMIGGEIIVNGSASDWVGGEMRGGKIHVHGNAGHYVGAAYRASPKGMTGGTILIHGDAGHEVGTAMRRGLIAIGGACGDLAGLRMLAGTIVLAGQAGIRHGAGMKRGTIVLLGHSDPKLLCSFERGYHGQPGALVLVLRELMRLGFPLPTEALKSGFDLYHGDMLEGGRGEVFRCRSMVRL